MFTNDVLNLSSIPSKAFPINFNTVILNVFPSSNRFVPLILLPGTISSEVVLTTKHRTKVADINSGNTDLRTEYILFVGEDGYKCKNSEPSM